MQSIDTVEPSPVESRTIAVSRWGALVEFFMPRRFEQPGNAAAYRFAVELGLLLSAISVVYALVQPFGGHFGSVVRALCWGGAIAPLCALLLAKRDGHFRVSAQLVLGYFAISNGTIAYHQGGATASSLYWFAAFPVAALLLSGRKSFFAWIGVSIGLYALFFWLDRSGHRFPLEGTSDERARLWLIDTSSFVAIMLAQFAAFDRVRTLALRALRGVNEALRIAREKAQVASQARTTFLTNMSHELRTPMTSILGFTDVLIERAEASASRGDALSTLQSVQAQGRTLLQTLDALLARAKSDEDCIASSSEASSQDSHSSTGPEPLAGCRVLVIDDSADNLRLVRHFLQRAGARVTCCEDGLRGLEAVLKAERAQQPVQVILLDIQMPVMDGHEVARRLRLAGFHAPIVAFTAHAMGTERERCLRSGFDDYATKPIDRVALVRLIARHAAAGSTAAAPAAAPQLAPGDPTADFTPWRRFVWKCLPSAKRGDPTELRRLSMLLSMAILGFPITLVQLVMLWHIFPPEIARWTAGLLCLVVPLEIGIVLVYRWTGSTRSAANLLAAYVLSQVAGITYLSGGIHSAAAFWGVLLPLTGIPLVGLRMATFWTGLCTLQLGAFFVAASLGVELPNYVLPQLLGVAHIIGAVVLMLQMSATMSAYDHARNDAVQTLASANVWLAEARGQAREAEHAGQRFLGSVSGDLRSPLSAMLGSVNTLEHMWQSAGTFDDSLELLDTVRRNAGRLLELIEDLLELARLDARMLEIAHAPFSPIELVQTTADRLSARAETAGVALEVAVDPSVPRLIHGDERRVQRVLDGLAQNALRFTTRGRIRLSVGGAQRHDRYGLRFAVSDTGCGIAPEQRAQLFRPFRQIDGSASRKHGGGGLGLALAHGCVEAMRGSLEVESELGRGSTFSVWLPLAVASGGPAESEPTPPSDAAAGGNAERLSLACHILVAEPDEGDRSAIRALLECAGALVDLARDESETLEKARQRRDAGEPYDLIVVAVPQEERSACSAARLLRRHGCTSPIVALSGDDDSERTELLRSSGCDEVTHRPIDARRFIMTVRRLTDPSKRSGA